MTRDPRHSAPLGGGEAAAGDADYEPRADPLEEFRRVFAEAEAAAARSADAPGAPPEDPTACLLSTADARGRPSARVVLLKGLDGDGFVFYTNYESRKGRQLAENPWAALTFYWPRLGWQVRAEGKVEKVSAEESDAYFASRPRGSRIGAWASLQSQPLDTRQRLVDRVAEAEERFAGQPVPRPERWGGYRLVPERVEHWRDRPYRLHDRWIYTRSGDGWEIERQYP